MVVLAVCIVAVSKLKEHRQREPLEVVDVLGHRQLQLLGRNKLAEFVETNECFQCFFASRLMAIQLWEEAAGEELDGIVVDMLVVHVVVFDGDETILVVVGFSELCVELRLVVRDLAYDVLAEKDSDRLEVFRLSVIGPVRGRLDVLDDDPF